MTMVDDIPGELRKGADLKKIRAKYGAVPSLQKRAMLGLILEYARKD